MKRILMLLLVLALSAGLAAAETAREEICAPLTCFTDCRNAGYEGGLCLTGGCICWRA